MSNILIILEGFLEKFYLLLLLINADSKKNLFALMYLLIACYVSFHINSKKPGKRKILQIINVYGGILIIIQYMIFILILNDKNASEGTYFGD